jgi:hypothetical protein
VVPGNGVVVRVRGTATVDAVGGAKESDGCT